LLWLYLQRKTSFFSAPLKVLHIAPEQAFYKRFRQQPNLEYITSDLYSPLADVKADICALPFEDEQFDVILCNHVLEHIPDDTQAMRELYRVLKKGGSATSGKSLGAASPRAVATATGPHGGVMLEAELVMPDVT